MPQPPQLSMSFCSLTQPPPQQSKPNPHAGEHVPPPDELLPPVLLEPEPPVLPLELSPLELELPTLLEAVLLPPEVPELVEVPTEPEPPVLEPLDVLRFERPPVVAPPLEDWPLREVLAVVEPPPAPPSALTSANGDPLHAARKTAASPRDLIF